MSLVIEIGDIAAHLISNSFAIATYRMWLMMLFAGPVVAGRTPPLRPANPVADGSLKGCLGLRANWREPSLQNVHPDLAMAACIDHPIDCEWQILRGRWWQAFVLRHGG